MVERKLLIDEDAQEYEGLFDAVELYSLIDEWMKIKGYDKFETLNQEQVLPEGKEIRVILEPQKWHTDYVRKRLKIELVMEGVKEVETMIDNSKVKLNQGKVQVYYTGVLETDWEGRFEQRPLYFFMRVLFEKYIFKSETKNFEAEIVDDVNDLKEKVGSFLNLYRFRKTL